MNDKSQPSADLNNEMDPRLEVAVWSVLSEPLPTDAIEGVKARARSLDSHAGKVIVANRRMTWNHDWSKYAALAACVLIAFGLFSLLPMRDAFAQVVNNLGKLVTAKFTVEIHGANPLIAVASTKSPDRLRLDFQAPGNPVNITNGALGELIAFDSVSNQATVNQIQKANADFDILKLLQKPDINAVVSRDENTIPGTRLYDILEGSGKVWVDLSTQLPKRIEMSPPSASPSGHTKVIYRDFAWDVPLADSLFALPADKSVVRSTLLARPQEAELVAAFAIRQAFSQAPYDAQFLDKSTRPGLRLGQMAYDLSKDQAENYLIQSEKLRNLWPIVGVTPSEASDPASVQKRIDLVCMKLDEWAFKIVRAGGWVGTGVRPGEAKPLCWWKDKDQIRVLRADLTIVDANQPPMNQ